MKKILSFLGALMLITAVSCSESVKESYESTVVRNYTAEKLSDVAAYRKESLTIPENCSMIWSFMPYNNGNDCILLGSGEKSPAMWHTSDFEDYDIIEFPEFDTGANYGLDTANDGTVVTFVVHTDSERDEDGLFPENAEYSFMIKNYSKDGTLVSSADVKDFIAIPDAMTSVEAVHSDGETVIAKISGAYEVFGVTGKYIGELSSDMGDIDSIGKNREGKLICTVAYKDGDTDKLKICLVNPDGTLTDYNAVTYNFSETPQGIQQGTGDYDFFLWSRSTIFGIKQDSADIEPLFAINAANLTSDLLKGLFLTDDGNIAVMSTDYSSWSMVFKKYIPRSKEEMEGIPVITIGTMGDGEYLMNQYVNPWNDAGHDFMLSLKAYDIEFDYENQKWLTDELMKDVVSGSLPDILITDGIEGEVNLMELGALCDLYEFIDKDETYNRDCFVPNVLECFETDGALYSLSNRFYLNVGQIAKTKFVGDGSDWSFDKYVDMTINPPVEIEIQYDSKQERLNQIFYTNWIDKSTKTCHYTDESFVKYLEWCNIPDNIESDYPDWSEIPEEEQQNNFILEQRRYIDDKAIFSDFNSLGTYEEYVRDTRGMFGGEEITYLETPTLDGNNNIAISADSENKELAWEYIKSTLADDNYITPVNSWKGPFPVTKSGLAIYEEQERSRYTDYSQIDGAKDDPEWKDYKGLTYQLSDCIYGDTVIKLGEITDEDVAFVNDMISRAEPSTDIYLPLTEDYYEIIKEETNSFFNGDTTAQQCAELIQSRVSIYLSEKFG